MLPSFLFQDIRDAFPDLSLLSVHIDRNDGRYKAGAKLSLQRPELLDAWPRSRQNVYVKNKEVSVCVGSSDGWLCVAKMPMDFTEEQFCALAGAYGKVKEAFLMVSDKTGEIEEEEREMAGAGGFPKAGPQVQWPSHSAINKNANYSFVINFFLIIFSYKFYYWRLEIRR